MKNTLKEYQGDSENMITETSTPIGGGSPTQPHPIEPVPKKPPRYNSEVTIERRSSRIRKESEKAQNSEFWQNLKRVAYEREDKRTRESMRTARPLERMIASLGVVVSQVSDEEKRDPTELKS